MHQQSPQVEHELPALRVRDVVARNRQVAPGGQRARIGHIAGRRDDSRSRLGAMKQPHPQRCQRALFSSRLCQCNSMI